MGAAEQQITLRTRAHNGKVSIQAEIPVTEGDAEYLVTIALTPRAGAEVSPLDHLYGISADNPIPEINDDEPPESRDFE